MAIGSIGTRTRFWEMNVAKSDPQCSVGQLDKIRRWNPLLPFHNVRHARLYEKIPGHIEGLMQCRRLAWQARKLIGDARSAKADCSLRKAVPRAMELFTCRGGVEEELVEQGKGKPDQGRSHFCLRPHSSPTVVRPLSAPPLVLAPPFS